MITKVEYNRFTDEHFIIIPDDIIEALKLEPGDVMEWEVVPTGVLLTKKPKQQTERNDD